MKVYVAVPTYGVGVGLDVYHNHTAMIMVWACKYGIKFGGMSVTKNQLIWSARNNLVESILPVAQDEDYIFWIDSDIILEEDTLPKLLSSNKDVVTGIYYQKCPPYFPLIMLKLPWENKEGMHQFLMDYPKGLYRVDAIGFGCVLTRVSVFKKMEKPWFDWKVECGEDIYFCVQAKKHGIEIWADTNVTVGHMAENVIVTEEIFKKYRDENTLQVNSDTLLMEEKNVIQ